MNDEQNVNAQATEINNSFSDTAAPSMTLSSNDFGMEGMINDDKQYNQEQEQEPDPWFGMEGMINDDKQMDKTQQETERDTSGYQHDTGQGTEKTQQEDNKTQGQYEQELSNLENMLDNQMNELTNWESMLNSDKIIEEYRKTLTLQEKNTLYSDYLKSDYLTFLGGGYKEYVKNLVQNKIDEVNKSMIDTRNNINEIKSNENYDNRTDDQKRDDEAIGREAEALRQAGINPASKSGAFGGGGGGQSRSDEEEKKRKRKKEEEERRRAAAEQQKQRMLMAMMSMLGMAGGRLGSAGINLMGNMQRIGSQENINAARIGSQESMNAARIGSQEWRHKNSFNYKPYKETKQPAYLDEYLKEIKEMK